MFVFNVLLFIKCVTLTLVLGFESSENVLVKEWQCANSKCSDPISSGKTTFDYNNPDHKLKLKFQPGHEVSILRKPAKSEENQDLWWIKCDEKEGYASKQFIQENKVINKKLVNVNEKDFQVNSNTISPTRSYEVVDGTTLYHQTNYSTESDLNIANADSNTEPEEEEDGTVETEDEGKEEEMLPPDKVNNASAPSTSEKPVEIPMEDTKIEKKPSLQNDGGNITKIQPEIGSSPLKESVNSQSLHERDRVADNGTPTQVTMKNETNSTVKENPLNVKDNNPDLNITSAVEKTPEGLPHSDPSDVIEKESNKFQNSPLNENGSESKKSPLGDSADNNLQHNNSGSPSSYSSKDQTNPQTDQTNLPSPAEMKKENDNSNMKNGPIVAPLPVLFNSGSKEKVPIEQMNSSDPASKISNNSSVGDETKSNISEGVNENNQMSTPSPHNNKEIEEDVSKNDSEGVKNNLDTPAPLAETNTSGTDSSTIGLERNEKEEKLENTTKTIEDSSSTSHPDEEVEESETSTKSTFTKEKPTLSPILHPNKKVEEPETSTRSTFTQDNTTPSSILDPNKKVEEPETSTRSLFTKENSTHSSILHPNKKIEEPETTTRSTFTQDNTIPSSILHPAEKVEAPEITTKSIFIDNPIHSPSLLADKEQVREESDADKPPDDETHYNTFPEVEQIVKEKLDIENHEDSSQKWFSSIHSVMNSLEELYQNSFGKSINSESEVESKKSLSMKQCDQENEPKPSDEYCEKKAFDEFLHLPKENFGQTINSEEDTVSNEGKSVWTSFKSILWLTGSSIVVLFFSLGYYYLENVKRDGELVQKNNMLSSQLFIIEREKVVLEEELTDLQENMSKLHDGKKFMEEELFALKEDFRKTKEEKINVEERETKLIKKLVMVEQNYNELRRIFSESKQKGERATLISDIKKLKESIAADNVEISSLKEELQEKKNEVKSLNANLQKSKDAKIALQERIDKMVVEGQEIAKGYQETLAKMEQTIEENKIVQSKLEEDLRHHKKECESLFIEKELAESTLQRAHGLTSTESLAEWLEVKNIRSSLIAAEKNISNLSQERNELLVKLESIEEKCKSLTAEVLQLNEKYENAEKEKIEALTKLQVLSNYFKEKETQLQEELGMKEAQWLQKQSEDSTIYQQMRDLREENVNLKSLIETLKKEILDHEASYKKIINTTEQKAQENWVSFRRAEIRLKEVQAEAAQLRNRLTTLETCEEDKLNKTGGLEVNGDLPPLGSAMSPPFMLYPNEFIPPPPLIPPPSGSNPSSRPPPLGRISSPPLVSGEFIPPPPLMHPYEVYSHVHPNPPSPPILHKPQPRDHHMGQPPLGGHATGGRKQKDSQSSNHSSESPLDKTPARRSKR